MGRTVQRIALAALILTVTACEFEWPEVFVPGTTSSSQSVSSQSGDTWALGDSQGAASADSGRGAPWTERLGSGVSNGALGMSGAGWAQPGINSNRTIPQQASYLAGSRNVDRFIVMAGVNDLQRYSVSQMMTGVKEFASIAAALGTPVTYVGIVPVPSGSSVASFESKRIEFNAALKNLVGNRYINCDAKMSTSSGWLLSNMSLTSTNLHLNDAGEAALATCILAKL